MAKKISKKEFKRFVLKEAMSHLDELRDEFGKNGIPNKEEESFSVEDLVEFAKNNEEIEEFAKEGHNKRKVFEFALDKYEREIGEANYIDKEQLFLDFSYAYEPPSDRGSVNEEDKDNKIKPDNVKKLSEEMKKINKKMDLRDPLITESSNNLMDILMEDKEEKNTIFESKKKRWNELTDHKANNDEDIDISKK